MNDFAILAPVPLEHLESGQPVAEEKGFVAFGSRGRKFFRDMDERRDGNPVPVLIYASDRHPRQVHLEGVMGRLVYRQRRNAHWQALSRDGASAADHRTISRRQQRSLGSLLACREAVATCDQGLF